MEYVINCTFNRSKLEVKFQSKFASVVTFLSARKYVSVDFYSETRHGVAKINSELVALRLLYTVMPITKF